MKFRLALIAALVTAAPAYAQQSMPTAAQGSNVTFAQPVVVLDGSGNPVNGAGKVAYASPLASVSVTTSSTQILGAGVYSRLILQTALSSTGNVCLNLAGGTAVAGQGICIAAGGGSVTFGNSSLPMPTGAIYGISDSGTTSVAIQGIP